MFNKSFSIQKINFINKTIISNLRFVDFSIDFFDVLESGVSIVHDVIGNFIEEFVDGLDDFGIAIVFLFTILFFVFVFRVVICVTILG